MARTAYEVQRDFALSSGLRSKVIWDSLSENQADILKQKISNIIWEKDGNAKTLATQRQQLFTNVWKQRVYTNRALLSAIIYVLVSSEQDPQLALQSTEYSCHPVIRTRKCIRSDVESRSEGCCMIFIDEHGRIYDNWNKYLYYNALPKGTLIAPKGGIYTFGTANDEDVQLEILSTPSSHIKSRILKISDTVAVVGGLIAAMPVAATLAIPVATPVVVGATFMGVTTSAYSTVRSASHLIDRRQHSQTTSLTDKEARGSWLGVAAGVVGLGATGVTHALSAFVSKSSSTTHLAVKAINVSSLAVSGTGVVNGVYDLYIKVSDEQPLSRYDVLQLASSLLIFTHAINNMRIASKATNGQSLRRVIRNQSKKVLDRISDETNKLHGGGSGNISFKFDIVRTLNDIPIKEVLLSLHTVHSHLVQGATLLGAVGAAKILPSFMQLGDGGSLQLNMESLAAQFGLKFIQHIGNINNFMDVVDALTKYFTDKSVELLMRLTRSFVEQHVDSIDLVLNTFVSTELVLYRMLMHCITTYKEAGVEFLESRRQEILEVIAKYFDYLVPTPPVNDDKSKSKRKCPTCGGVYYICKL